MLSTPSTRLSAFVDRAFSATAPTLWNSLPIDIQHGPSCDTFKKLLKPSLFTTAHKITEFFGLCYVLSVYISVIPPCKGALGVQKGAIQIKIIIIIITFSQKILQDSITIILAIQYCMKADELVVTKEQKQAY